ncbi:MAG: metallophosphatase family protein [Candidatus Dormibacteraeota bacterium]|nr:metallophosphatase family protein [Candidatus Dormibacteraeota bacterium]
MNQNSRAGLVRIGVIADTHCPEFLARLPDRVGEVLAGVDLILHAGDVGSVETLEVLGRLAPVVAVRGDHDSLDLPPRRTVEVGGMRIGLIHGNRSHLIEEPITFLGTVTLGHVWPHTGLAGWLRRQFPEADVIVYGHTHLGDRRVQDGVLIFNPGAVYQVGPVEARERLARHPGWFEWSWLQVIRHRRVVPPASVGIISIGPAGPTAEIIPL